MYSTLREHGKSILPVIVLLLTILASCSKGSKNEENKPPQSFTVSVSNATYNSATLNWTAAKDPENATVTYSIELNNQAVGSGVSATSYSLQSLTKNTNYTGKVTASDPSGNKTSASFNFSTGDAPTPSDFTVKMDSASNKSIALSWTASTLPGNAVVTYDVYVNGIVKGVNLAGTKYVAVTLLPNTDYAVKVVAKSADGKSLEKTANYKTKENIAPAAVTITEVKHGFSYVTVSGTKASDADKDVLTWYIVKNNVESAIQAPDNTGATFTYTAKGLNENEAHTIAIRIKDEFGATITSNAISTTTYKAPASPAISVNQEGNKVVVQWINTTLDQFDVGNSLYYIAGSAKAMTVAKLATTVQPDNTTLVKLSLDLSEFVLGTPQTIKVSLNWGDANSSIITSSNTISFTRNTYTPTIATVSSAKINGPGQFPPQFFIYFTNCVISEYENWDIEEVKFDNVEIINFLLPAICDPMKPGYFTGNVTNEQYTYLKTKNTGYVVIKDAGGLHKIDFTYTTQD
jgi:hypothetical protein